MIASIDVVEVALALCLTGTALVCLFDRHLLRACRFFVAFAIAMALAWWQLGAIWLASAELLLGAVLTGLCCFYALGHVGSSGSSVLAHDHFSEPWTRIAMRVVLALVWFAMVAVAIGYVLTDMQHSPAEHPLLLAGVVIAASAMASFALHRHLLRRLLAFNLLGSGVFMLLAGVAGTTPTAQVLISVGLLVAALGSMLGVLLIRQLLHLQGVNALDHDSGPKESAT